MRGLNPTADRISVQVKLGPSASGLPEPEENLDVRVEVALLIGVDRADEFPVFAWGLAVILDSRESGRHPHLRSSHVTILPGE